MLLKALEIHLEAKLYDELFVFLWYGLFGKREIQESLKTKRDSERKCGLYFTFTHLCGLFVLKPLVGFLFQFYFLIAQQFVYLWFCKFLYYSKEISSFSCTFFYCLIYV